jgi:hypothetical protein
MKKLILFTFLFTFIFIRLKAQETTGIIKPGEYYKNDTQEALYFLPRTHVVKLFNYKTRADLDSIRVDQYKDLSRVCESRLQDADSTITLKQNEALYWKSQLNKTDTELLDQRKLNLRLKDENRRVKRSRVYYLLGGTVVSSVILMAIR